MNKLSLTEITCVRCGWLLTVADRESSQPNYCNRCQRDADPAFFTLSDAEHKCAVCRLHSESLLCPACQQDAAELLLSQRRMIEPSDLEAMMVPIKLSPLPNQ